MSTLTLANIQAPGTYIAEQTAGFIPAELASFNTTYMLGTATGGPYNTPTQILDGGDSGVTDLQNQFTSSPSQSAVQLFFRNNPNGILYFIRCSSPDTATLTVTPDADPSGVWSVDIDANTVSYTATATNTTQEIIDGLITAINTDATVSVLVKAFDDTAGDSTFKIQAIDEDSSFTADSPTAPVNSTLAVANDSLTAKDDYIWALSNAFDEELRQGFIIAPEAFQSLNTQSDRTAVAVGMENLAASEGFAWMALVDSGPEDVIDNHTKALVEGQLYTTAQGFMAYFFPYVIDLGGNTVPPSAAISGLAVRRYREQGFQQPPAGAQYPLRGVTDVAFKVTKAEQEVSNPLGLNAVRNLPNKGVVVWASRTRSSNQFYRFVNTRIILNVLIGTLRPAFDSILFTAVDGRGVLFTRIQQTIEQICHRLWIGNALYGARAEDAFAVRCDANNNPAIDLEAGVVRADVWVVPAPILERLLINLKRTSIGQIQAVVNDSVGG